MTFRFSAAIWCLGEKIRLQSYIRPVGAGRYSLLALMEFAGEGLISCKSSKDQTSFRFGSPRSDLSRHQSRINLRNLSVIHLR